MVGRLRRGSAGVRFRRQSVDWNVKFRAKIPDLVGLRFKILVFEIPEDEIQHGDARADVFKFVFAAVAVMFLANLAVEGFRKEMVDGAAMREAENLRVPSGLQFGPKLRGPFAPMCAGEAKELTRYEVPGVHRDEVKKVGFLFGIAEGLDRFDLWSRADHREIISVLISRSSSTRRIREASSRSA